MQAHYRSDYPGEFVILRTHWSGSRKKEEREWIANPIENHHISGRAACIGSNIDKGTFDYTRLQRHRGGLLGSKKLQTYGVGDIAFEMRLDFAVETQKQNLQRLIENQYSENNIVYTTARNCIANPGQFYLIPHRPPLHDVAQILYLAAFDGHKEVFLLGYNKETSIPALGWQDQICLVTKAYSGVKFYLVGERTNMLHQWLECDNVSTMTYREFISYCDV